MCRAALAPVLVLTSVAAFACSPAAPAAPAASPAALASRSRGEELFPLEAGKLYHYTSTDEGGETGMLVARVERRDATHGALRFSHRTKFFVFEPDGVRYEDGAYILRAPWTKGASWPGEHGGTTRIDDDGVTVTVAAGTFAGCVRTVEEGGQARARFTTVYCPMVGIVLLEVESGTNAARVELKSYGSPVVL